MTSNKRRRETSEPKSATEPFPDFNDSLHVYESIEQQDVPQENEVQGQVEMPSAPSTRRPSTGVGEILLGKWRDYPEQRYQLGQVFITARLADDGALYFHLRTCNRQWFLVPQQSLGWSQEGMPLSEFSHVSSQIEWMEDVKWRLATECQENLYAYVFVELYQCGRLSSQQCTTAFIRGHLTLDTFHVAMGVIVTKVVDCRPWSDRERGLLVTRFTIAQEESFDFLT